MSYSFTSFDLVIKPLRADPRVLRVEVVPFPDRSELWVTFRTEPNLERLNRAVSKTGLTLIPFGNFPSKLPRGIGELLWNGVTHVVGKPIAGFDKLRAALGFEPPGIAKLAVELHGTHKMYVSESYDGIKILFDFLGLPLKMPPPAPAKPPAAPAPVARPATPAPAPRPTAPASSTSTKPPMPSPQPAAPPQPPAQPAQPSRQSEPEPKAEQETTQ